MPLNRPTFDVYVNEADEDQPVPYTVTITHQDQLRAESSLSAMGIEARKRPLAMTTAWCWAAVQRMEVYKGPLKRFLEVDCAGVEEPETGEVLSDVDPTQPPADTDSVSNSPESGPESTG